MKSKNTIATSALRSVLAAISNAESVQQRAHGANTGQYIAGGTAGLASAEAERRTLTREETTRLVRDEITDRQAAAQQYETAGQPQSAPIAFDVRLRLSRPRAKHDLAARFARVGLVG